ncbi:MAG TPA: TIM barrel protein [Gemmataceae bacterium]|jgi:hypothetical protein|nr:TIM barrel protein [Gemmataceae bacterium]
MRPIGFSTGALALADVHCGLALARQHSLRVVELSSLRDTELTTVLNVLGELDPAEFQFVSFHAPSAFLTITEVKAADRIRVEAPPTSPIIVHPDVLTVPECWRALGPRLCIENMDKRKPTGRTATELAAIFDVYPEATLCFDIGHARQVDPTMGVAADILRRFGDRLCQVHISEVNARNRHEPISYTAFRAFRTVAHLIPEGTPIVSEAVVDESAIGRELFVTAAALSPRNENG